MHNPIYISALDLSFGPKVCFSDFSYTIYPGEKIAIIGDNGSGKSSLLKLLANLDATPVDAISHSSDLICSYIPQTITEYRTLSGGQRFNKSLSEALARHPNLLLLDEPTNHLDLENRKSLMRLLKNQIITQIIASHDVELLDNCVDTLWHIHDGYISVFNGKYSAYRTQLHIEKQRLEQEINKLNRAKVQQHEDLMKEQQRAKKKKTYGEKKYDGDKMALRSAQGRGQQTANKNNAYLNQSKDNITQQLRQLWVPEEINYSFTLTAKNEYTPLITINNGRCAYLGMPTLLHNINFNLFGNSRVALSGANGCGKSTLIKAIMHNPTVARDGEWIVPDMRNIAYLDQHYSNLPQDKSVIEYIQSIATFSNHNDLRQFLNQFLFRKHEEVQNLISCLSGGEKARLSLASIALQQPRLLILDEITNNIDLTTREHITRVLKTYPGAMLVISHDENFLEEIQISEKYDVTLWKR